MFGINLYIITTVLWWTGEPTLPRQTHQFLVNYDWKIWKIHLIQISSKFVAPLTAHRWGLRFPSEIQTAPIDTKFNHDPRRGEIVASHLVPLWIPINLRDAVTPGSHIAWFKGRLAVAYLIRREFRQCNPISKWFPIINARCPRRPSMSRGRICRCTL